MGIGTLIFICINSIYQLSTEGDACLQAKTCECTAAVGGGVVGGFTTGVLITAVVATVICVVLLRRIR